MNRYRGRRNEFIDESSDPLSLYETKELGEILDQALASLSSKARKVIRHRYGFGAEEMTIPELAKKLKLSKSRVQAIERRALEIIRTKFPQLEELLSNDGKVFKSGRFRLNERVQVIGDDSTFYGYGRIVGFRKLFFSFPELYPEIKLESGERICDSNVRVYKDRESLKIADRIMRELFPKDKK